MDFLRKLDIYGLKAELLIFEKQKFTTWFGGVLTIVMASIVAVLGFFMGRDFWLQTNPKVIRGEVMPEKSQLIYPNSSNFTILYRLEDRFANAVDGGRETVNVYFTYNHFKRNEANQWTIAYNSVSYGTKCDQTKAIENQENLQNIDLSQFYCVDWEEIAEAGSKVRGEPYSPVIGGTWEEDEVSYLTIQLSNIRFVPGKPAAVNDNAKADGFLASDMHYVSLYYPESFFDGFSKAEPLNRYWKNYYYKVDTVLNRIDRFYIELNRLEDDSGWIFENISESISVSKSASEVEMALIPQSEAEIRKDYYTFMLYAERSQVTFKRSYMKIQELAAVLGGFVKGIQLVFYTIASQFARFKMVKYIKNKELPSKTDPSQGNISNNYLNSSVKCNNAPKLEAKQKTSISFFKYILSRFYGSKEKKLIVFEDEINKTLDIKHLFELSTRISQIERKMKQSRN